MLARNNSRQRKDFRRWDPGCTSCMLAFSFFSSKHTRKHLSTRRQHNVIILSFRHENSETNSQSLENENNIESLSQGKKPAVRSHGQQLEPPRRRKGTCERHQDRRWLAEPKDRRLRLLQEKSVARKTPTSCTRVQAKAVKKDSIHSDTEREQSDDKVNV